MSTHPDGHAPGCSLADPCAACRREYPRDDRTELEIRLQELAWRLTAERDVFQAGYDKLGPLLVAQAQENVTLRALLLTADEAEALLDLIIESDHPATEPWGTIADKLVGQRDRNQTS